MLASLTYLDSFTICMVWPYYIAFVLSRIDGFDRATLAYYFIYMYMLFYKLINSTPLDRVLNIATVALYPKNQPFAVPGLTANVCPTVIFSNLCV